MMTSVNKTIVYSAWDFGGTNSRTCGVVRDIRNGRFTGMPRVINPVKLESPKKTVDGKVQPDMKKTLEMAAASLREQVALAKEAYPEAEVVRFVGCSAPGAYLENGTPYKGTTPNIPDLDGFHLSDELGSALGPGWAARVNNDGINGVLTIAKCLLDNIGLFPEIQESLMSPHMKLAGFIPGTGFGAGGFKVSRFVPSAHTGPQQFFDIGLSFGDSMFGGNMLTPEDTIAGVGLARQARKSFLARKYGAIKLDGIFLQRLAFSKDKDIPTKERDFARGLYLKAAESLATLMTTVYKGGDLNTGMKKVVVNDPVELELRFWTQVSKTRTFILGGWLSDRDTEAFISPVLEYALRNIHRNKDIRFIFADKIPGIKEMLAKDSVGLTGAALLIPDKYGKG